MAILMEVGDDESAVTLPDIVIIAAKTSDAGIRNSIAGRRSGATKMRTIFPRPGRPIRQQLREKHPPYFIVDPSRWT